MLNRMESKLTVASNGALTLLRQVGHQIKCWEVKSQKGKRGARLHQEGYLKMSLRRKSDGFSG